MNILQNAVVTLSELKDEIDDYQYLIIERKKKRIELIEMRDSVKIVKKKYRKVS